MLHKNHGNQATALSNSETDRTNTILLFLCYDIFIRNIAQPSDQWVRNATCIPKKKCDSYS